MENDEKNEKRIETYAEFWDFYVAEHSQPLTRLLHFVGTSLGIVLLVWVVRSGNGFICRFVSLRVTLSPGFRIFSSNIINRLALDIHFGLSFPITK